MRVMAACLATAITLPAWAAEPAHCYRDPPPDALPGKQPSPFSFIDYAFGPTIAWRVCGYDTTRHAEIWRSFYESHGCSADSDAGQLFERLLTGPAPTWSEDSIRRARVEVPDLFVQWCEAWQDYRMPRYDQVGLTNNDNRPLDERRRQSAILEETDRLAKEIGKKLGLR